MAKAGRPKQDVIKDKVVSVRMKPDEYKRIKQYADSLDKTVTEVIQEGISSLMKEEQKENGYGIEEETGYWNERHNAH